MDRYEFYKFHGTGNDFIVLDGRSIPIHPLKDEIEAWCHRRFGIGADGLMVLLPSKNYDFEMKYFNADGNEGSMCGNGGRCIAAFAYLNGIVKKELVFEAVDGIHSAVVEEAGRQRWMVKISLNDLEQMDRLSDGQFVLDTGSPHLVKFVNSLETLPVLEEGKKLRWDPRFQPEGINVNFAEKDGDSLNVVTFERGVEDITLSCGTGVTACAIAITADDADGNYSLPVNTRGGKVEVSFQKEGTRFQHITLYGPAEMVFSGTILR